MALAKLAGELCALPPVGSPLARQRERGAAAAEVLLAPAVEIAAGATVIKCPSPLNVPKDAYDHSCY